MCPLIEVKRPLPGHRGVDAIDPTRTSRDRNPAVQQSSRVPRDPFGEGLQAFDCHQAVGQLNQIVNGELPADLVVDGSGTYVCETSVAA